MTEAINVQIIDFTHTKVAEAVTHNTDGSYTIFLNARLSKEKQLLAYTHALDHIARGDFDRDNIGNADTIEVQAHCR